MRNVGATIEAAQRRNGASLVSDAPVGWGTLWFGSIYFFFLR